MSHSTISLGLGLGGGKAATSSGAPGGGGDNLIPGEQAVIDLGPSFWVDASWPDAVKSEQTPVAPATEANATNGQEVSKWISRAGSGIELTQTNATNRPVFNSSVAAFGNYSTITFDSSTSDHIDKDARYVDTSGDVGTIFYVGKELNGANNCRIINWSTENNANLGTNYAPGDFAFYLYRTATPVTVFGTNGIQLNPYMAAISLDGSSSYVSVNEATNTAFTAGAEMTADVGPTSVSLASNSSSTQAAEYIIFNTALSPTNVALVETYLKNKYKDGGSFG